MLTRSANIAQNALRSYQNALRLTHNTLRVTHNTLRSMDPKMAHGGAKKMTYKWTDEDVDKLIRLRMEKESLFSGKRFASAAGWEAICGPVGADRKPEIWPRRRIPLCSSCWFLALSCCGSTVGSNQSPSLMHILCRMALQAMILTANFDLTSNAPRNMALHLVFIIPKALSTTERALAWCRLYRASTAFLRGSL
ncbi:uncharacterized protein LOC111949280 isoform X2 [Oryzias latipes]|uniref:uncharacterized protein LOC111949280 isoform X2 n=1 Tax=Oryzias latipes TaxID=8090 RepID=UPI000CE27C4B|nr:uncharacterized protein LOC111949280 isoform X2 [Oryzias latipes]